MIVVNGRPRELPGGGSLAALLAALGVDPATRGVAVAVDGEVVPRGEWETRSLADGAMVEVLGAMQGG